MGKNIKYWDSQGRNIARDRYGQPQQGMPPANETPRPQNREDRRSGTGVVPQSWVTGRGEDGRKPGFDHVADRLKGR